MVVSLVKVPFEGAMESAEEIGFQVESQSIGVFKIADGATIELQHTVKNIYRLADKKREDGSPIYIVTGEARLRTTRTDDGSEAGATS